MSANPQPTVAAGAESAPPRPRPAELDDRSLEESL